VTLIKYLLFPLILSVLCTGALAQGTRVAFGNVSDNKGLPVEITADSLSVDQKAGTAIFTDNVVIVQGEMRLSAQKVVVVYREETGEIAKVEASGDVVLVSGEDAAESDQADYNVEDGTIVMSGNVLVAQGPSALTADRMTVQLEEGTAQMSGRVKTVLQKGGD
jgi:lipopolysaccharide export system protein LptA